MECFTADQISGAVLLNAPDIYGWHASASRNDNANGAYTDFLFSFRAVFGFVVLLMLLSLLRRSRHRRKEGGVNTRQP
ncbi:MAG: hypothetical protein KGJ53_09830 [Alphaproteobacteria bacterium]|nr:hypothetical protein [Alphaproteobacteria bacterium]